MIPWVPKMLLILKEACKKFWYNWKLIDNYSNNLVEVSKWDKFFFSSNGKIWTYPLNPKFSAEIANDKAWTYSILKQKGYKVPEWDYFFIRDRYRELRWDWRELKDAFNYAEKIWYAVFVKPNCSSYWFNAEIIQNKKALSRHLKSISEDDWTAIIQEIIKLPEYRLFVIDWNIEFYYWKARRSIIWNGLSSIRVLVSDFNSNDSLSDKDISIDSPFFIEQIKSKWLTIDSVLNTWDELLVSSNSNVSLWWEIVDYWDEVSEQTKQWARQISNDMQMRVCWIDVFVDESINNPDSFTVIEINHNPNLARVYDMWKKDKVLGIWKKILSMYFNK